MSKKELPITKVLRCRVMPGMTSKGIANFYELPTTVYALTGYGEFDRFVAVQEIADNYQV